MPNNNKLLTLCGSIYPYEMTSSIRTFNAKLYQAFVDVKLPFLATLQGETNVASEARELQACHLFPTRVQATLSYDDKTFLAIFLPKELNVALETKIFGSNFWLLLDSTLDSTLGTQTYGLEFNNNEKLARMVSDSLLIFYCASP